MRSALIAVIVVLFLGTWTTVQADIIFDFNPSNTSAAVGSSQYSVTQGTYTLTVSGFNVNNSSHDLYWKFEGAGEHGIGFTNPVTGGGTHELSLTTSGTVANYMEINVSQVYQAFPNGYIRVQSIDAGSQGIPESYDIYGSNAPGSIGTVLTSGVGTANNNLFVALPSWGTYAYYSVATHPEPNANLNDVLFDAIKVTPEPATLTLLALGGGLAFWRRRRHR
jgi:hypothetical protein